MGVLNVTPDSFSDAGQYVSVEAAVLRALAMVEQGATFIDIGGESTRPGAQLVSTEEELRRVIPVIEALREQSSVLVSIDTSKPEVMQQAILAGAALINDVYALRKPGALETAARFDVPVCLMHMQGSPEDMQKRPTYTHVVDEVIDFFKQRLLACEGAGIARNKILLDPGFGFGKTLSHNLTLLAELSRLKELNCPLLAGLSRKSMLGAIIDKPVEQRLSASITAGLLALQNGASILRVHDVAETADAVAIYNAVRQVR
ncbi:MAG: dihydropteroate synthase [Cycloclasticus sp. symbiont of Poecilosclerida sp. M]|nr:MAG: dihydropteroate synthase [Cycloclasticus sp. symbiont of Poecilosclerida sp. M]